MAAPIDRFTTTDPEHEQQTEVLPLVLPAELQILPGQPEPEPPVDAIPLHRLRLNEMGPAPVATPITIELDKTVPASGNLSVKGQQVWLGADRAGTPVALQISTAYLRVLLAGVLIKTVASKLTASDLHALVLTGHARVIDTDSAPVEQSVTGVIEIDRTVNAVGYVSLANRPVSVGFALAGRRVILWFHAQVMTVLEPADRTILRSMPNPLTTRSVAYLRGARPGGPPPTPPVAGLVTAERIVSSSGGIMITRQRIQIGRQHARKVVTMTLDEHTIQVHHAGHLLVTTPRTSTDVVTHRRAHNQ